MKKLLMFTFCALIMLSQPVAFAKPAPVITSAKSIITMMTKSDFAGAAKNFDPEMKSSLPPDKLREVWTGLIQHLGDFKRQVSAEAIRQQDGGATYDVVNIKCEFARATIIARVVFDKNRRVSGLFFTPVKK